MLLPVVVVVGWRGGGGEGRGGGGMGVDVVGAVGVRGRAVWW